MSLSVFSVPCISIYDEFVWMCSAQSFSNMMDDSVKVENISLFQPLPSADEEHGEDDTLISPTRKRGQRAANYSSDEDVALIRAWESVSLDAIAGVDQSSSTFWSRISEHFHGNGNTTTTRTIGSLQHRWSTIQECCNKWKSCLAQVARQHPSGVPLQEQVSTLFMAFKAPLLILFTWSWHFAHFCFDRPTSPRRGTRPWISRSIGPLPCNIAAKQSKVDRQGVWMPTKEAKVQLFIFGRYWSSWGWRNWRNKQEACREEEGERKVEERCRWLQGGDTKDDRIKGEAHWQVLPLTAIPLGRAHLQSNKMNQLGILNPLYMSGFFPITVIQLVSC